MQRVKPIFFFLNLQIHKNTLVPLLITGYDRRKQSSCFIKSHQAAELKPAPRHQTVTRSQAFSPSQVPTLLKHVYFYLHGFHNLTPLHVSHLQKLSNNHENILVFNNNQPDRENSEREIPAKTPRHAAPCPSRPTAWCRRQEEELKHLKITRTSCLS